MTSPRIPDSSTLKTDTIAIFRYLGSCGMTVPSSSPRPTTCIRCAWMDFERASSWHSSLPCPRIHRLLLLLPAIPPTDDHAKSSTKNIYISKLTYLALWYNIIPFCICTIPKVATSRRLWYLERCGIKGIVLYSMLFSCIEAMARYGMPSKQHHYVRCTSTNNGFMPDGMRTKRNIHKKYRIGGLKFQRFKIRRTIYHQLNSCHLNCCSIFSSKFRSFS